MNQWWSSHLRQWHLEWLADAKAKDQEGRYVVKARCSGNRADRSAYTLTVDLTSPSNAKTRPGIDTGHSSTSASSMAVTCEDTITRVSNPPQFSPMIR